MQRRLTHDDVKDCKASINAPEQNTSGCKRPFLDSFSVLQATTQACCVFHLPSNLILHLDSRLYCDYALHIHISP